MSPFPWHLQVCSPLNTSTHTHTRQVTAPEPSGIHYKEKSTNLCAKRQLLTK